MVMVEEIVALMDEAYAAIERSERDRGAVAAAEMAADVHRVVRFVDREWARLREAQPRIDALEAANPFTRDWNPERNMIALVGEATFSRITGLPWNLRRRETVLADGGVDFPLIDVKGTEHRPPWLKRKSSDPFKAEFFALVVVDLERRTGRYVGHAARAELMAAPEREFVDRTTGRSRGKTRTLTPAQLHPGLPPTPELAALGF